MPMSLFQKFNLVLILFFIGKFSTSKFHTCQRLRRKKLLGLASGLAQDETHNWSRNLARLEVQDLQDSKIGKMNHLGSF